MKSYFCDSCGTEYNYSECLRNGHKMYCYRCPSAQLHITGWPLVMVGVALAAMYLLYNGVVPNAVGGVYIFLPASFGLVLVGILRLVQAGGLRKRTESSQAEDAGEADDASEAADAEEDEGEFLPASAVCNARRRRRRDSKPNRGVPLPADSAEAVSPNAD